MSKKNKRVDVVYSTQKDFGYTYETPQESETLLPGNQFLTVGIDRKQRKGKPVTMIMGFVGTASDLKALGKEIKSKCGVGGSAKDGVIYIQGEVRQKVIDLLHNQGYTAKSVGG